MIRTFMKEVKDAIVTGTAVQAPTILISVEAVEVREVEEAAVTGDPKRTDVFLPHQCPS